MAERITFTTADDVIIVGDWSTAPTMLGAVVLVHAMPDTRSSWATLQQELAKRSIASLAIDLRGHGESMKTADNAKVDYREFTDAQHQASTYDVAGAVEWVRSRGQELGHIALGGASIGANLALRELINEPKLAGAVLLSPGTYRGIDPVADVENVLPHQALFVVSSEDDSESFGASRTLFETAPTDLKAFTPYKTAGHGIHLFETDRALAAHVADWFVKTIRGG